MTSNYVARKYGIKAGMPLWEAKKACRDLVCLEPSKEKYEEASKEFKSILKWYDPHLES